MLGTVGMTMITTQDNEMHGLELEENWFLLQREFPYERK
jgi:hypothetical protein